MPDDATKTGDDGKPTGVQNAGNQGDTAGYSDKGQPNLPSFDVDALKQDITQGVVDGISKGWTPQVSEPPAAPPQVDPIRQVIDPIVGPDINKANLVAQGAMDAAVFYSSHPEAVEHRSGIEQAFKHLMDRGTPFVRDDIWAWTLGKDPDLAEKIKKTKADAAARSAEATSVGPGSPPQQEVKKAEEMSHEDLTTALQDITF